MSGLLALCGLALLVQHVVEPDPNIGGHLIPGVIMLALAVMVWCLSPEPNKE
jgi:hypothetical protein